ncbi:MAG TPA: Gfo/Idh/MocA family oxidoreductase [Verrucomicrobiae bacterium]|nr:Gfo/Idh/MocA family oxidoreductase [Verrucomicrobiae bacterium]
MNSQSRRKFFIQISTATAGTALLPRISRGASGPSANGKLNVAVIGAGGKGSSDTDDVAKLGENIVALCDVDKNTLAKRGQVYPKAKQFSDYRKMLDQMGKEIDAVIVSTPDHHHAVAASMAMKMGKHAYVQKPLTHSVYEARLLRDLAKKHKVATQMGNQGSAEKGLRRAVEVIQAGAIGSVSEVHVWSNRPIWPQGLDRPEGEDPVPDTLDWDLFLGPAPKRPFKKDVYHPFKWRGWQDFGTGALGDMACHTANMPFRALKLGYPTEIEAESSGMNKETYPKSSKIRFEFPAREGLKAVRFWWYDGGQKPDNERAERVLDYIATTKDRDGKQRERKLPGSGCLLIGDKGHLFSPDDYGAQYFLLPQKEFEGFQGPAESIPRSPGHYREWVEACRGGAPAYSNFDIAAYLTEIILLGCVALRTGKKLEWDGPAMKAKNAPEAAQYVKRHYRKGWEI